MLGRGGNTEAAPGRGPVPRGVPGWQAQGLGRKHMEDLRCSKNKAGAGRPGTNSWDPLSCVSLLVLKEDRFWD